MYIHIYIYIYICIHTYIDNLRCVYCFEDFSGSEVRGGPPGREGRRVIITTTITITITITNINSYTITTTNNNSDVNNNNDSSSNYSITNNHINNTGREGRRVLP